MNFIIHKENWQLVLDIYIIQFTHGFYHPQRELAVGT